MKQDSISLVKVTRPILKGVFPRERLFRLLDKERERSVIWISGPPGSGKTTLVNSYIDSRKLHSLWYRIDESDAGIRTFFNYMNLAVKKVEKQKQKSLSLLSSQHLKDITTFTLRYFDDFYSRLKKTPFIVVLDNFHKVQKGSLFHKVINSGLSKIPEGVNVIVISRSGIPSVLARMRANYLPAILGWSELRLTQEELEGIVKMRGHRKQSDDTVQLLYTKTGGWVTGLMLILERAKSENIDTRLLNELTPDEIFDYFATEIFEKLDKETQGFLLKTAFLPRMTVRMAENLTGLRNASRILTDLNCCNYFTEKCFEHEPVYQYHPLFREFLLSCTKDLLAKNDLSKVQRKATSILVESGLIEDAAELFSKTCDWEGLIQLVHKHAQSLVAQGRNQTLEKWLTNLPNNIIEDNPWLLFWKGLCCMPFSSDKSYEHFKKSFQLFKEQKDISGIYLAWSGAVESIVCDSVLTRLDKWILILDEHMRGSKKFPSKEIEARVASCMFTALVLRQPQHPDIDYWAELAMSLSQESKDITIKIRTLLFQVWHKMFTGDFTKAALLINSLKEITQSGAITPIDLLKLKDIEAFYYWLTAMHENGQRAVSDGIELAHKTGVQMFDYLLLGHGAAIALSAGDMATAKRFLQKMTLSLGRLPVWNKSFYHFLVAWEALLQKDMTKALLHVELALKLAFDAGVIQTEAICRIEKAQVMHELREQEKAEEQLELARSIASKVKSQLIEFMCFLTDSQFAFDRGEEKVGLVSLRKAMAIGKKQGYVNTFIWRAPVMTKLCEKALETGIEAEYIQEIIKKRGLVPDIPPLHIENWPWPLKIYTLGRFGLVSDGKSVRFSGKVQKKPLSLLKALITLGGREVSEEQLMDILWYEADGDVAHKSFATTLHRLRKLVGNDKAIKLSEGRLTLDPRYCWADVWAFERILGQVDAAWKEGLTKDNMIKTVQLAEKAFEMYKGPFLAGETDQSLVISFRERLRSKFLRNAGRLGLYWERAGDFNRAVNCYQKGLEVDDLAEEFYQRLMICYHKIGRRAEALTVYNRCRNILSTVLGVEPSPETETIYKSFFK